MPFQRYPSYAEEVQDFSLPDRTWPDKKITQAPIWCAVVEEACAALTRP